MKRQRQDKRTKQIKDKKSAKKDFPEIKEKRQSNSMLIGFILAVVSFFISIYFIPATNELIGLSLNRSLFYLISVIFSVGVLLSFIGNKLYIIILKYLFLASILYLSIIDLVTVSQLLLLKLKAIQTFLVAPTVLTGLASVWFHREKFNEVVAKLFQRDEAFSEQSGYLKKIIKPLKDLFLKKNLIYTLGLFLVLGISVYTMFNKLDYFDLYSDESQVTEGAVGYYHTGEFKQWNFIKDDLEERNYDRAFPHLYLVAQSYKIFGITPWAGRAVSAFFGLLLIILGYFISYYFTKSKLASLLIIFSFAFYFEYLLLFRWTRMYALIIPIFFLMYYLVFKFLTGESKFKFLNKSSFLKEYLNFNYRMLIPFFILFLIAYYLHLNSLFILPVIFLFSIISFIIFKEKKYLTLLIFGIAVFAIAYSLPQFSRFAGRFTFFEADKSLIYSHFIAGYPLNLFVNSAILGVGLFLIVLVKNKGFRQKILFLYVTGILSYILFAYVLKYSISFRYISLVSPPVILLIISLFFLIAVTLYNKILRTGLILILLLSVVMHFSKRYDDLYVSNFASPAKPSLVYPEIAKNIKPGEKLMMHWGPRYYLDDIDTSINTVKLGSYKPVKFSEIYEELNNSTGSWLTWHTQFGFGVSKKLQKYADKYFIKHHGYGLDSTFVELYYADSTMIADTTQFFTLEQYIPTANININKPYSLSFFAEMPKSGSNIPIFFTHKSEVLYHFEFNPLENKLMFLQDSTIVVSADFPVDNKKHHVSFYISENGNTGFYIGNKHTGGTLKKQDINLLKMSVNIQFLAAFNDIRLYAGILNKNQIQQLSVFKGTLLKEIKDENGNDINALFKWSKN